MALQKEQGVKNARLQPLGLFPAEHIAKREEVPQGLKPASLLPFHAGLKACSTHWLQIVMNNPG